jgi:hypothetical protein
MNTEGALGAARRLAVDLANITYRLALLESGNDLLREAVMNVDPEMWHVGDKGEAILQFDQADAVRTLIAVARDVL